MKIKIIKHLGALLISGVFAALINFAALPAWNIQSKGFWWFWIASIGVFALVETIWDAVSGDDLSLTAVISWVVTLIAFVILCVFSFFSSKMINAKEYQKYFDSNIQEVEFNDVILEEKLDDIATMDTASARQYGSRKMGEIPEAANQFVVSENYTQIAFNGKPLKVAPLEYSGLIKANSNRETGTIGFVTVDPVKNDAKFNKLDSENSIRYSPSAIREYDLHRNIRRNGHRDAILGLDFFELDEEGNHFWITQKKEASIGLFGGKTITGIFVTNPYTGEVTEYAVNEVPEWVDIVFDGDYICDKFNDYGVYVHGFWNSLFGEKDCKVVTNDFGYKIIDNDVYIYTGVVAVNNSKANIAFLLVNSRTMDAYYIPVNGASESSAMSAAEGELSEKGYQASFPSLVNISGEPTYLMVLKDDNGLVKNVAMVNVNKYDIIAIADNLYQVENVYKKLLSKRDIISKGEVDDVKTVSTVINSIEYVVVDGSTVVYIKTDKGVFKQEFEESLMLLDDSDAVTISFYETGADIEYIESVK